MRVLGIPFGNGDLPLVWLSDLLDSLAWTWEDLLNRCDRWRHP